MWVSSNATCGLYLIHGGKPIERNFSPRSKEGFQIHQLHLNHVLPTRRLFFTTPSPLWCRPRPIQSEPTLTIDREKQFSSMKTSSNQTWFWSWSQYWGRLWWGNRVGTWWVDLGAEPSQFVIGGGHGFWHWTWDSGTAQAWAWVSGSVIWEIPFSIQEEEI